VYPEIFSAFSALFCGFMKNEHSCAYKSLIPN
jgi:hypothetical protein